jgi:phosphoribosyl 1,2-cyclic phosphodiesterase
MKVTLWGTRGSLACSGPDTERYGGETSCIEVRGSDDSLLILDAGTGIRRLGVSVEKQFKRFDILLTHLHLDHIQGLGFFNPLYDPAVEIHVYGPAKNEQELHKFLSHYWSPPLFPVLLRDLPCKLHLHALPHEELHIGQFHVTSDLIIHPGLTVGYRIISQDGKMAYLPDHEPALGAKVFPNAPEWTSGYQLASGVDLLIHDAQYTSEEYQDHVGWGHSSIEQTLIFGALAKVKTLVAFHHDPGHDDNKLEEMLKNAVTLIKPEFQVDLAQEGKTYYLG